MKVMDMTGTRYFHYGSNEKSDPADRIFQAFIFHYLDAEKLPLNDDVT